MGNSQRREEEEQPRPLHNAKKNKIYIDPEDYVSANRKHSTASSPVENSEVSRRSSASPLELDDQDAIRRQASKGVTISALGSVIVTNDNKRLNTLGLAIVDSSPLPIVALDHKGVIVAFNKSAQQMFGYEEHEVVGMNVSMLMPEEVGINHDKYIARYLKTGRSSVMGEKRTLFALRKNGQEFPIELEVAHAIQQGIFVGYIKETTMEHRLHGSQGLVHALVNMSTIPIIGMDQNRIINIVSTSVLECFGYVREELIGKNIKILMEDQVARHHDYYVEKYLATGEKHVVGKVRQLQAMRKNGELFPVELKVNEITNSADNSKYFIGYVRDMSAMVTQSEQHNRAKLADAMFPPSISLRLSNNEQIHDKHEEVSVLFADIVGFTSISDKLSADKLVGLLDDLFHTLDNELLQKYQLEKVKTIGDCYMLASGIPHEHRDHANNIVEGAVKMIQIVKDLNEKHKSYLPSQLRVRVGINSGNVVAGIVGYKKPLYDVFGDTVNVASRMESGGTPNQVHISEKTYQCLTDQRLKAMFIKRGAMEVKGKGQMETYITQLV
jgi:PAS domain S-box-containing protein